MTNDIESLAPDTAYELLRESHHLLATRMISDAARIFNDDYSDDDTDYMPARAYTYARFTFILMNADDRDDILNALIDFRNDSDAMLDYNTLDHDLPLDDYLCIDDLPEPN